MDLIYMNDSKEDVGVLKDYTFDLAYGEDENDFECKVHINNNVCNEGYYLYYEGEEYGGIIDSISVDTDAQCVTYIGRTWHGLIESKIIQPLFGDDYLEVNGDANDVLKYLISVMDLDSMFSVNDEESGITINHYKMDRYIAGYTGICKMLKAYNAKLNLKFNDGFVELSASPLYDYSQDDQFDSDQIAFTIQKNFHPINHVICLGKGDLKERRVIHLYSDGYGNVSGTPTFLHGDEVVATYDYPNAESDEDLIEGGLDIIRDAWSQDAIDFDFKSNDNVYDIGDIIGASERLTGTVVKAYITKKIVTIDENGTSISYDCGSNIGTVTAGDFPSSGEGTSSSTIAMYSGLQLVVDGKGDVYAIYDASTSLPRAEIDSNGDLYITHAENESYAIDSKGNVYVTIS